MLQAALARSLDRFRLELELAVPAGTTLVVVGESGAGKTTLLRVLAGLLPPETGEIVVGGVSWHHRNGRSLPAWERSLGFLFQDYALFPHLRALDNVAFGLIAEGRSRSDAARLALSQLERFGLAGLADRRPHDLSGGQQQRVALARALVLDPDLLLLDEPLAALDLQTRREVRGELRGLLVGRRGVTVYVTHSPLEAMALGDRIAVLEAGRVVQVADPATLLQRPRTPFVAEFMGLNFFRGPVVERAEGLATVRSEGGLIAVSDPGGGDGEAMVAVNPRDITLFLEPPEGSARNLFQGPISELIPEPPVGDRVRVALATRPPLVAEVTRQAVDRLGLKVGTEVYATFKAVGVQAYR